MFDNIGLLSNQRKQQRASWGVAHLLNILLLATICILVARNYDFQFESPVGVKNQGEGGIDVQNEGPEDPDLPKNPRMGKKRMTAPASIGPQFTPLLPEVTEAFRRINSKHAEQSARTVLKQHFMKAFLMQIVADEPDPKKQAEKIARMTQVIETGVIDSYNDVPIEGALAFDKYATRTGGEPGKGFKDYTEGLISQAQSAGGYTIQPDKTVWAFWGNRPGEPTPYFVELCIATIQKNMPEGFQLVIVNLNNYKTILGEMLTHMGYDDSHPIHAYFADRMRIQIASVKDFLLFNAMFYYGGIVIDATSIALRGGLGKMWGDFAKGPAKFMTYTHTPCIEKRGQKYTRVECTAVWYMMAKKDSAFGAAYMKKSADLVKKFIGDDGASGELAEMQKLWDADAQEKGIKNDDKMRPAWFHYLAFGAVVIDQLLYESLVLKNTNLPPAELLLMDAWDMANSPQMYEFGVDPYSNMGVLFDFLKMDVPRAKAESFRRYCMLEQRIKHGVPFLKFQNAGGSLKDTIIDCTEPYNHILLSRIFIRHTGIFDDVQCPQEPFPPELDLADPAVYQKNEFGYGQASSKTLIEQEMQAEFKGHGPEFSETSLGGDDH